MSKMCYLGYVYCTQRNSLQKDNSPNRNLFSRLISKRATNQLQICFILSLYFTTSGLSFSHATLRTLLRINNYINRYRVWLVFCESIIFKVALSQANGGHAFYFFPRKCKFGIIFDILFLHFSPTFNKTICISKILLLIYSSL